MSNTDTTTDEQLRIAIAKKLGWKWAFIKQASCGGDVYESAWFAPGLESSEQTAAWICRNGRQFPPDFLHDPAAALLLVEYMRKEGWDFGIETVGGKNGGYWVIFYDPNSPITKSFSADAPTFPLAVAKSFAQANGLEY